MRSGGSVLKAPQRRRGATPLRSVNAKLRKRPCPRIPHIRRKTPCRLPTWGRGHGVIS